MSDSLAVIDALVDVPDEVISTTSLDMVCIELMIVALAVDVYIGIIIVPLTEANLDRADAITDLYMVMVVVSEVALAASYAIELGSGVMMPGGSIGVAPDIIFEVFVAVNPIVCSAATNTSSTSLMEISGYGLSFNWRVYGFLPEAM